MSASDEELFDTAGTYAVPQLLYVAAKLRIAERVRDGAVDVATLAAHAGVHEDSLGRALGALASVGVFAFGRDGRVRLTSAARLLLPDHPRSRRAAVLFAGGEQHRAWGAIMWSMATGRAAFEQAHGRTFYEHLAHDPDAMEAAEAARARRGAARDGAILEALDLAWARSVVDVGGGSGDLLSALLERQPSLSGVLLDAPHVAERARPRLAARGLASRCTVAEGDAREAIPEGHDAYLLVEVIHCMKDDDARAVLERCRGKRVYVIDRILPPRGRTSSHALADLHMLVMFGGRERTRRELSALLSEAGLRLHRVVPTSAWVSILEARPART